VQAVAEYVCGGGRLGRPEGCPEAAYGVMASCWVAQKDARPVFTRLKQDLQDAFALISANESGEAGRLAQPQAAYLFVFTSSSGLLLIPHASCYVPVFNMILITEMLALRCALCLDQPATVALVPCGHRCVCEEHAALVANRCPICRAPATGIVRVFDT
jgi:hypothetical protein